MTMVMPSQYSQLLPIFLLLVATILATVAEQPPITLAGCPDKCGDISIPFPFGMKTGCFRKGGFEVMCDHSFNPPRAFLNKTSIYHQNGDANYSAGPETNSPRVQNRSDVPVELFDISALKSELRGYGAVRSDCGTLFNTERWLKLQGTRFPGDGSNPFLLSPQRNVLTGVGWNVQPKMVLGGSIDSTTGYMLACLSLIKQDVVTDGSCSSRGCCEASFPADKDVNSLGGFSVAFQPQKLADDDHGMGTTSPCSYGMIVERSWYNFSSEDMYGRMVLPNKFPRGVPFVLDFAIRDGSCPGGDQPQPKDYACVSGNSTCAKAPSGVGYVCRCWDNYDGNPYITNGCQDINECEHPHLNNCSSGSICKNTLGSYECPCKPGRRGNGKEGVCTEKFPLPAKVAVGLASFIVVIVLVGMAYQLLRLKRFYEQNGGPLLKGVMNIRIYTSKQLKQITENYKYAIGEGHFGKVYMGTLKEDKQKVAIKKTIKVNEHTKKEFTDEVIIQSGMRHKNIVRLLGCCLEMKIPMLMYEYAVKGSLNDFLFKNKDIIPVDTRLGIAIGSAEGLTYMHSAMENTARHGDVKSANILLDENFTAKISDFGTTKLLARGVPEIAEWVMGDKSYIDPEYMTNGTLTQKSDVYSFGIVLIELITRRAATYDEERSYVVNFVQACQDQRGRNLFDNDITSERDIELLEMVSKVALECLKLDPEERPDMKQVEMRLLSI